jgi:hypothetical protein
MVIINISSATLHNAMIVTDDDVAPIGTIDIHEEVVVEVPSKDNYRVIFTLKQESEEWLGTDNIKSDTLRISDKTKIFEIEVEKVAE